MGICAGDPSLHLDRDPVSGIEFQDYTAFLFRGGSWSIYDLTIVHVYRCIGNAP